MLKNRTLLCVSMMLLGLSQIALAAEEVSVDETHSNEPLVEASSDSATEIAAGSVVVDGDKIELYLDRKMRAIGDASISQNGKTILGDTIDYDVQNEQLDVKGNAQINVGNAKLTGPALSMQLSDDVGEMKDASITLFKPARENKDQLITISSEAFSKSLGNLQSQQIGGVSTYTLRCV